MTGPFRGRSLRTIRRAACPQAAVPVCDKEKSLADRCRGRRPRRLAEGSRPLPTMQTVKGDTVARLRAGHARPLRTAVKIYAREGQGRAAARPYGWRKVRGQGCRELRPRRPAEGSRPLPTMQKIKGRQWQGCGPGMPGPYGLLFPAAGVRGRLAAHNERRQFAAQTHSCGCLPRRGKHCSLPSFAALNCGPTLATPQLPNLRWRKARRR